MGKPTIVPISHETLRWAIERSGFAPEELAANLKLDEQLLNAWLTGEKKPTLTQFKKLTTRLQRPAALFFMQQPPSESLPKVSFRAPTDSSRAGPNPKELRYLREAYRLQRTISWIRDELGDKDVDLPKFQVNEKPEAAAAAVRKLLLSPTAPLLHPDSAPAPWKIWRNRLEEIGVIVLALPLGNVSCRGFSLWDSQAPLIALNTSWNNQARLFSLLHEVGHLVTRTQSVCVETSDGRSSRPSDKIERWAERFSASVLMPWYDVSQFLTSRLDITEASQVTDLSVAKRLAREFDVSLRAAVIRLIEHNVATWDLYRQIPSLSDAKRAGGGGKGRVRREKRVDEYGKQTMETFVSAVENGLLHRSEALSYLNIADSDFNEVRRSV
jgi:Zn-dependent peptidase ImmA (M78 family)